VEGDILLVIVVVVALGFDFTNNGNFEHVIEVATSISTRCRQAGGRGRIGRQPRRRLRHRPVARRSGRRAGRDW
jgi:hypothetical protein